MNKLKNPPADKLQCPGFQNFICSQFQVLQVLKTRQVAYSMLTHLSEYIQNLQKTGLLEEKEMVQLDDALQVARIFNLLFVVVSP
jgi:hypothetical protein